MQTIASARVQTNDTPQTEAGLRQILNLSPDAVLVQAGSHIVFVNSRALKMFRASSPQEILGRSFYDFLHPDTKLIVKARLQGAQSNGGLVETFEHQLLALDGTLVRAGTTAGMILWNGKKAVQIRIRDLMTQTEFEIRLRESETLFHQLADSMPQIVWMANADGEIDYHNRKWFEQTRLTEEEANKVGMWKAVLHLDDAVVASERWEQSVRNGEPFQMEYRYKDFASGGFRWHLGRALPVRNDEGVILRWFGTCTDIHDQKLTEIALEEAKEQLARNANELEKLVTERTVELEETVRSSEALNYSIAHDLRAPLRAMMGFSNALLADYATQIDSTGQEYAQRIAAAAQRMDNLISALLEYGRLNYEELSFGFINTGELLENLINDFEKSIHETGARIILTKPFPKVWANVPMLKKVFVELIGNALKFRSPERQLRIEFWAEEQATKNLIWIRDNGIGISSEHHERIFHVLESLHTGNQYAGTGIGLAIVRRAIERMNGRIGIKSAPDEGTCFWIELPKALV